MRLFTKIKHWQIFLLFFVATYFMTDRLTMLIVISSILTFFSLWIYSIGTLSHQEIDKSGWTMQSTKLLMFSCFFIPFLWLIIALNPAILFGIDSNLIFYRISMLVLIVLFLTSLIYSIFFAAKTIKTLELKRQSKFKEYILIMFGIFILPIGIWFIQPKVNNISA